MIAESARAQNIEVSLRIQKPDTCKFSPISCLMLKSTFKRIREVFPSDFYPSYIQEFQPQLFRTTKENFQRVNTLMKKVNHHKVVFGFIKGTKYYIVDTNNDGSFLDEKKYPSDNKIQPIIILKNVALLEGNTILTSDIAVQYLDYNFKMSTDGPNKSFFILPSYSKGQVKIKDDTYIFSVKKFKLLFENPTYEIAVGKNKDNECATKNLLYKPGDTAIISNMRLIFAANSTDQKLGINFTKLSDANGYDLHSKAIQIIGRDILSGRLIDTRKIDGHFPILLDFWGAWCLPCRKISPALKELYRKYSSAGLTIISIASDDTFSGVKSYLKESGIKWGNIFENRNNSSGYSHKYKVQEYPTFILIDNNGRIILRQSGIDHFDQIEYALKKYFRI